MAFGQPLAAQGVQHVLGQAEKTELVRDGGLAHAEPSRAFLLAQPEQADEPRHALRLLYVVEVAPLQVLHERDQAGLRAVHLEHDARHLVKTGQLRRPQTALPGHQLILPLPAAHGQRTEDAVAADALGHARKAILVEYAARLAGVRRDLVHPQADKLRRRVSLTREQRHDISSF